MLLRNVSTNGPNCNSSESAPRSLSYQTETPEREKKVFGRWADPLTGLQKDLQFNTKVFWDFFFAHTGIDLLQMTKCPMCHCPNSVQEICVSCVIWERHHVYLYFVTSLNENDLIWSYLSSLLKKQCINTIWTPKNKYKYFLTQTYVLIQMFQVCL